MCKSVARTVLFEQQLDECRIKRAEQDFQIRYFNHEYFTLEYHLPLKGRNWTMTAPNSSLL